jgi:hypothetical protein
MSQTYPSFSCSKLTTHCTPGGCIIVIFLINRSEVYASRMLLLLAPVSSCALSRCSSLLTMMRPHHFQLIGWLLGEMIFLAYLC